MSLIHHFYYYWEAAYFNTPVRLGQARSEIEAKGWINLNETGAESYLGSEGAPFHRIAFEQEQVSKLLFTETPQLLFEGQPLIQSFFMEQAAALEQKLGLLPFEEPAEGPVGLECCGLITMDHVVQAVLVAKHI